MPTDEAGAVLDTTHDRRAHSHPTRGSDDDQAWSHHADHPDQELASRLRAALNYWLSLPPPVGPTSQITGGGAVGAVEELFSRMHDCRPALLVPSATYGLRVGLSVVGVGTGDEVLIPAIDWPASWAAVTSLGARPVPVPIDVETLTISPSAAAAARTACTRAVIACHLHGVPADIPALRATLPDLPIIEDVAEALGSTLDGHPTGTLGDCAVFSLGPNKQIDAGEGGIILFAKRRHHQDAVRISCHPLRQLLSGAHHPTAKSFSIRPHPLTALIAIHQLSRWSPESSRATAVSVRQLLATVRGVHALGDDPRRASANPSVPLLLPPGETPQPPKQLTWVATGAQILGQLPNQPDDHFLARIRLASLMVDDRQPTAEDPSDMQPSGWHHTSHQSPS